MALADNTAALQQLLAQVNALPSAGGTDIQVITVNGKDDENSEPAGETT